MVMRSNVTKCEVKGYLLTYPAFVEIQHPKGSVMGWDVTKSGPETDDFVEFDARGTFGEVG